MRIGLFIGVAMRAIVASGPPVTNWPYVFPLTRDKAGFGSSTMNGVNTTEKNPFRVSVEDGMVTGATYYAGGEPASGGVVVTNRGAGGTTSATVLTTLTGGTARQKAADVIFQLGGNYETPRNPVPGIVTNAQSMATVLGHNRFIHIPKHHDNGGGSGSADWHRLRRLTRELRAIYPGRVQDAALMFRDVVTGVPSDDFNQARDEIPATLAADAAHANLAGNRVLAREAYVRWFESQEGGVPFVPHQHVVSTATTNQTNGGFVADIEYDVANPLTGASVSLVGTTDFSVSIVADKIKLYRASATFIKDGYTKVKLKVTRGGKSITSILRVYLAKLTGTSGVRAKVNRQGLIMEGPINGKSTVTKLTVAIGIKPLPGWDALAATQTRQFIWLGGNKMDVAVKQSANMNLGVVMRNAAGTIIYNLDTGTGTTFRFNEANGTQWFFLSVDWDAALYNQAVEANVAQTTGWTMPAPGEVMPLYPAIDNVTNQLFTNGVTTSVLRALDAEIVGLGMWEGYVDFAPVSGGNRDKVRNPTTKESVLNTTRGTDTPGMLAGLTPFLWMEGPAANWQAGLNLANPNERWDTTDRDNIIMVTV